MNNERYNQIIDEAYENYEKSYEMGKHLEGTGLLWMAKETKGTFIYRSKTDSDFSQKWGIQIEERELSQEERIKLYEEKTNADTSFFPVLSETLVFHNIPTKLITTKYKNETIESYE